MSTAMDDARPWYAKASFLVAAAFVVAVLAVGLVLVFALNLGDRETPAGPEPAPSTAADTDDAIATTSPPVAAPEQDAPSDTAGECSTPEGSEPQAALTTPPDVEWLATGEVPAAVSEKDGPAERDGLLGCYAPTSGGALLAAYNFLAQYRTSSNDPVEVVETFAADNGPRYDELLEYSRTELDSPDAYGPFDLLGYRFYSYDGENAEVALVHAIPGTTGTVTSLDVVTLRWAGDTWTVWTLTDLESVSEVPAGFVPWGTTATREE